MFDWGNWVYLDELCECYWVIGFDKLGVFHANQISMCLDSHLN